MSYQPLEVDAFRQMMEATGMPAAQIDKIVAFNLDIRNGQEAEVTDELAQALGRPLTPLKPGIRQLFNL